MNHDHAIDGFEIVNADQAMDDAAVEALAGLLIELSEAQGAARKEKAPRHGSSTEGRVLTGRQLTRKSAESEGTCILQSRHEVE